MLHALAFALAGAIVVKLLWEGRAEVRRAQEEIRWLEDLDALVRRMIEVAEEGMCAECVLVKAVKRLEPDNLFRRKLERQLAALRIGHADVISLVDGAGAQGHASWIIEELRRALACRGDDMRRALRQLLAVVHAHMELLRARERELHVKRWKARILVLVNAATMAALASVTRALGAIRLGGKALPVNSTLVINVPFRLGITESPPPAGLVTLAYLLMSIIAALYTGLIVRESRMSRVLLLCIASYTLTHLMLSALLP